MSSQNGSGRVLSKSDHFAFGVGFFGFRPERSIQLIRGCPFFSSRDCNWRFGSWSRADTLKHRLKKKLCRATRDRHLYIYRERKVKVKRERAFSNTDRVVLLQNLMSIRLQLLGPAQITHLVLTHFVHDASHLGFGR